MAFIHEIGRYQVIFMTLPPEQVLRPVAQIMLFNTMNQFVGDLFFYRFSGSALPSDASDEKTDPKTVQLRFHENQLFGVIDMLRNEKPCFVRWATVENEPDPIPIPCLYTGEEPIGEGPNFNLFLHDEGHGM